VIIHSFTLDFPALKIAELSDVSRPAINQLLLKLRIRVAQVCDASSPFSGEVKVDESYFGARRVRGKKGRGAEACDPGLGSPRSIIHADGWRGYNGLVDMGYKKHFRVHHGENEFARGNFHINGIESFWSYAKRRLAKFNGVPR